MSGVAVTVNTAPVQAMLDAIVKRMGDMTPAMREIGEIVVTQTAEAFEDGGLPGHAWKKSGRVNESGGQTLVNTSRLRNSINYKATKNDVEVGTNVAYAAIHQLGGQTKPHVIRPKNGKALFWPGASHPVKSVNHPGSKIPARPFLPDEAGLDWEEIESALMRYLL
ncbi:MAG: phage virion morphogenesis protein [Kiritimatiellia bacterium]